MVLGEKTIIIAITVFAGNPSTAAYGWTLSLILTLAMLIVQRRLCAWVESADDPDVHVCGMQVKLSLNNLEVFGIYCQLFTLLPCGYFLLFDDTTSMVAIACAIVILTAQTLFVTAVIFVQYSKYSSSRKAKGKDPKFRFHIRVSSMLLHMTHGF